MAVNPKIVKYFIKSSPVGEVGLVLKDLCQIIDKEMLQSEPIMQALREYFEEHKYHVKLPDGRTAMVTEIGRNNPIMSAPVEVEEGEEQPSPTVLASFVYFDSALGVKFSFDPNTMEATIQGDVSDFPEQLDEQWTNYK